MKERILYNWTFTRVLYLGIGAMIIINAAKNQQWLGVILGSYFAAMGVFAFGCAAGNCLHTTSNCEINSPTKAEIQDIEFEEIKQK